MKHWFSDVSAFRRDPLDFVLGLGRTTAEPLARMHLGRTPVYLVVDPGLVKPILKAAEAFIDKGVHIAKLRPVLGDSSLTMSGDEQRRRRAALHGILARGVVERLIGELAAEIRHAAAIAAARGAFDAHEIGAALALRLVTVAVFGRNVLSDADEQAMILAVKSVEDDVADEMFRAIPLSPWEARRRRKARRRAREIMLLIVSRVRQRAAETSAMHALNDIGLTDEEMCDEVLTLLLAGHHTTGANVTWILHHLANEPGLCEEIRREAHFASGSSGEINAAALRDASLSAAFIRETLRLYPSSWWFAREVQADTNLSGVRFRRKDCLIISPWLLHRDARHWDEPETFRIDRDYANRAFLPFGAGPRVCVGMGLAMLELQLIAMEFASAFQLKSSLGAQMLRPRASVTLQPPPIQIHVEPVGENAQTVKAA